MPLASSEYEGRDPLFSLSQLNSEGIQHAKSLRYGDAIQCFRCALDKIREMKPVNALLGKLKEQSTLSLPSNSGRTSSFVALSVYDEGMNHLVSPSISVNPLPTDDSSDSSQGDSAAVLAYNLGDVFLIQGYDDGAIECFRTACRLTCAAPGCPKNGRLYTLLLQRLHAVGRMQYGRGEIEIAIRTFNEALSFCQDFCACNMTLKAATLNCLGVLHIQLPDPDLVAAMHYLGWALSLISLRERASDDLLYATILNNMGRVHCAQRNLKEAEACFVLAMDLRQITPGVDRLDLAATLCNLGQTCQLLGRFDEAIWYYQEFLRVAVPRLGPANRDVSQTFSCMAQAYSQLRLYDEALSCLQQVLTTCKAVLGDHPETVKVLNKMGQIYCARGDYDAALAMYARVLEIEKSIYEPIHPSIMMTFSNIIQMHDRKGDKDSVLRVLNEVLNVQVQLLGMSDSNVAATVANIGLVHYQKKDYVSALETHQQALRIRRRALGDDNLEVASSLNSIGLVLFKMGSRRLAIESFLKCLHIRRAHLGDSHRDVATTWYNIASIHVDMGNNDEALRCYQHSLKAERAILGAWHKETLLTLQNIALIHERRGDIQDALEYHVECLNVLGRNAPRDDVAVARELTGMADLYLQLGKTEKVMQAMTLATRLLRQHGAADEANELRLYGFLFYSLAKLCPEQAAAA